MGSLGAVGAVVSSFFQVSTVDSIPTVYWLSTVSMLSWLFMYQDLNGVQHSVAW